MAKFYEVIGFEVGPIETEPGIWTTSIEERYYFGDIIKTSRRDLQNDKINSDITLDMSISIISDDFALSSLQKIKYVKWMGSKWHITGMEVRRPRIILSIGGIYNG